MENKFKSLLRFYLLTMLLLQCCVYGAAQQTPLFSDHFSDNHNNWNLKGKKITASIGPGYLIDNLSKENFIVLQPVSLNPEKNFSISATISSEYMEDSKYNAGGGLGPGYGYCGIFFGAKDEMNGYSIGFSSSRIIKILKWENGKETPLLYDSKIIPDRIYMSSGFTFSIKSENGRWKIKMDDGPELGNIPAQSFFGDKIGVFVEAKQKWRINSLEVYQVNDKQPQRMIDFPADEFISRLSEIICEAKDKYKNVLGNPYTDRPDCYFYTKTVPGFNRFGIYVNKSDAIKLSELGKYKSVELVAELHEIENEDAALTFFEKVKTAINKCKSDCNIPTELNNDLIKKELLSWNFTASQVWANFSSNPVSLILAVRPSGGTDGIHKNEYMVEFHCILSYK